MSQKLLECYSAVMSMPPFVLANMLVTVHALIVIPHLDRSDGALVRSAAAGGGEVSGTRDLLTSIVRSASGSGPGSVGVAAPASFRRPEGGLAAISVLVSQVMSHLELN